ncbi:MAG: hypothetical protein ACE5F9_12205 [Phycisphaerae bacterium]
MQQIKIGVIVVALVGAGVAFWLSRPGSSTLPDAPESATEWMCDECRHAFSLTISEVSEAQAKAGGASPLFCPACNEKDAYRVATCPKCATKYFSSDVPGSSGVCPKCHPDVPVLKPKRPTEEPSVEPKDKPDEEELYYEEPVKKKKKPPPSV